MEKTIGERIKDLIAEVGISNKALSQYTGISEATISEIISDKKNRHGDGKAFSYKYFVEIAKFFNVSTDYLFGIDDMGLKTKRDIVADHLIDILDIISFMARDWDDIGTWERKELKIVLGMK